MDGVSANLFSLLPAHEKTLYLKLPLSSPPSAQCFEEEEFEYGEKDILFEVQMGQWTLF